MLSLSEVAKEIYLRVDQGDSDIPPLSKNGVFELTKAVFDICGQALSSGEEVSIPKFGKFQVVVRKARGGRNPHTGKPLDIPARASLKFKPSLPLRLSVGELDISKIESEIESKKKKRSEKKSPEKSGKKKKK